MKIAIDASRAFLENKTGIEEYAYQVIKHLRDKLGDHEVVLYVRITKSEERKAKNYGIDFNLPDNWNVKLIPYGYLWTQIGLAWQMLVDSPDVLFVPAHTIPMIHPKNTVVVVHGLEYERCPESYSFFSRLIHRFFVKKSCRWADKIIAVSKNTKKDLEKMYKVPEEKIEVIYNGYNQVQSSKFPCLPAGRKVQSLSFELKEIINQKYLLFIGRLEKRKNVAGIVSAFGILKKKYNYPGKLVLAGKPGHGYDEIKFKVQSSEFRVDIVERGYVSEEEKWQLLKNADAFLFPSLCEGFGIPILEAQSVGVPVITSNFGPMDEVAGNPEILTNPENPEQMAGLINQLVTEESFRRDVIEKGLENVKNFSWEKCSDEIAMQIYELTSKSTNKS